MNAQLISQNYDLDIQQGLRLIDLLQGEADLDQLLDHDPEEYDDSNHFFD